MAKEAQPQKARRADDRREAATLEFADLGYAAAWRRSLLPEYDMDEVLPVDEVLGDDMPNDMDEVLPVDDVLGDDMPMQAEMAR